MKKSLNGNVISHKFPVFFGFRSEVRGLSPFDDQGKRRLSDRKALTH